MSDLDGGWAEWGRLVLAEIKRLDESNSSLSKELVLLNNLITTGLNSIEKDFGILKLDELAKMDIVSEKNSIAIKELRDAIESKLSHLSKDVIMLKVKAGVWGLIAGMIPVAITIVVLIIKGVL